MKISRLKNIIIAMLLAADLVLAAVLGARAFESWRLEEDAAARASEALAALGAEAGRDMLGDEPPPLYMVEIERDLAAERALAETFVGTGALVRDGSGSYRIEGERGTARLYGAGRFEAEISAPAACPDAGTFIELAGLGGIETVTGEDTVTQLVRGQRDSSARGRLYHRRNAVEEPRRGSAQPRGGAARRGHAGGEDTLGGAGVRGVARGAGIHADGSDLAHRDRKRRNVVRGRVHA